MEGTEKSDSRVAPASTGLSRRRLLQAGAVGAGALWVTPAVLSFGATPAAASPLGCLICNTQILTAGQGTTANLSAWSVVGGTTPWGSTGTVFEANGSSQELNRRQQLIACLGRVPGPIRPCAFAWSASGEGHAVGPPARQPVQHRSVGPARGVPVEHGDGARHCHPLLRRAPGFRAHRRRRWPTSPRTLPASACRSISTARS